MDKSRDKIFPGRIKLVDLDNARYISRKPLYDFIMENENLLRGRLLDFGCGSGQYRPLFKSCDEYTGLDVRTFEEVYMQEDDCVFYDGKDIPFSDYYFDTVVAIEVLLAVENEEYSFREINRVLKKRGVFLFTVPMTYPLNMEPYDFRRYTKYGIQNKMINSGFKVLKIEPSTRSVDTLRRMKIVEMKQRNDRFSNVIRRLYQVYANSIYMVHSRGNKAKLERINSKLPIDWMVICEKV